MTTPSPLLIVAADPKGIKVRATRTSETYTVPQAIQDSAAYQRGLRKVLDRVEQGTAFDGDMQPAVRIEHVNGEFVLHCQETKYSYACATSAVAKERFDKGEIPALFPLENAPPASSGLDTALLTADNKVLISLRSSKMGKWPNCWAVGFGEGLEAQDLEKENLFGAGIRCLEEELHLNIPDSAEMRSRFTAMILARENDSYTWNTYAVLDLRGLDPALYSASAILESASKAKDFWEATSIVPLEASEINSFLADKQLTPAASVFADLLSQYLVLNP